MAINTSTTQILNNFRNNKASGAFKHFKNRATITVQIQDRINQPHLINQGYSSLCGPAAFLYCLTKKSPAVYAKYIVDLFETGKAKLGKINVVPSTDTKNFNLPSSSGMSEVDWIGLASLRDSENDFLDYQSHTDQAAGITMPGDLLSWFTKNGYTNGVNDTNLLLDKNLFTLLTAHQKQQSGHAVCLFVGADVLNGKNAGRATPDHWVVLDSPILIDSRPVIPLIAKGNSINTDQSILSKKLTFNVFTWGQQSRAINQNIQSLSVEYFLDYFYGYVSSK